MKIKNGNYRVVKTKRNRSSRFSYKKDNRFLIEIYLDEILETAKIEVIEDILTKVLKEKIVLNDEASVGKD